MFLLSVSEIDEFFTKLFGNLGAKFTWANFFVLMAEVFCALQEKRLLLKTTCLKI